MNSALIYRQALLKFTVPVAALVTLVLIASLLATLTVADYQTRVARAQQMLLADGAMASRREQIEKTALDYGAWDDAVDHLVNQLDVDWADANIGEWTFKSLGFDMAFVVAPDGSSPYASIDGQRTARPVDEVLSAGFEDLVARQRAGGRDAASSGLILADGLPAIAVVAPIRYFTPGRQTAGPQTVLVLVDGLRPELLDQMARTYLLPHLRILPAGEEATPAIALKAANGEDLSLLSWDGARPGNDLLQIALPLWFVLTALLAVLAALMLRQARATGRMLSESEWRATHDALTRMPNRVLFFERLDAASRHAADGGPGFALLYLDLDGFKLVNDLYGHQAGDTVLRIVSDRIRSEIGGEDVVARLGGDEFTLLLPGRDQPQVIQAVGQKLIRAILVPIRLDSGREVAVGATIGATLSPGDGTDPLLLLRRADEALFIGKRSGKGQVRFYAALAAKQAS